jgi:hypothetical protein
MFPDLSGLADRAHESLADRNGSGQGHFTVKIPVWKEDGRSARLLIYTDTPIQINS